jgi:probable F420-dependent oxidoreductase
MKLGIYVRSMGPQSTRELVTACARAAEDAGLDDLWIGDHIAVPPNDAEGSGGRYLDPLATLAYLAGTTTRINLGVGVLVLPYRPALPTAKLIATIQELSGGRLLLGVGGGWMEAEFRAVGVDFRRRGRITDQTLEFLHRCFASDEVEANGQPFLFLPRPQRPPIYVGGAAPHALRRTLRYGDGWMPMWASPDALRPAVAQLREMAAAAGKPMPEIIALNNFPLDDRARTRALIVGYAELGATRVGHAFRYTEAREYAAAAEALAAARS